MNFLNAYGAWVAIFALLAFIIIWYIVWPWFKKVAHAYHRMYVIIVKFEEAAVDPGKVDNKGYAILISRHALLRAIENNTEEIKNIRNLLDTKICPESCPAFAELVKTLETLQVEQVEYLAKIMALREGTQKEIDGVYDRINKFIDNTLDKRDELFARVVAALERVSSERKNGGK